MLHNTRGIAIHSVKFSETSIIVKIYTENFGLKSYIIKGIRKEHSKIRPGLFQPLTLLDLTVYNKEKSSIQIIRDAGIAAPYQTLPFDILKSSVAIFISELIFKSIREEESNPGLFRFLWDSCLSLDSEKGTVQLYPLLFMIRLTKYLGIMPQNDYSAINNIFDLQDGTFRKDLPGHNMILEEPLSGHLDQLLSLEGEENYQADIPSQARGVLLDKMLQYYRIHLSGFPGLQSHSILHTILS